MTVTTNSVRMEYDLHDYNCARSIDPIRGVPQPVELGKLTPNHDRTHLALCQPVMQAT